MLHDAVPSENEMHRILAEARRWDVEARFDLALEMERAEMVTWWLDDGVRRRIRSGFPGVTPWLLSPMLRPRRPPPATPRPPGYRCWAATKRTHEEVPSTTD